MKQHSRLSDTNVVGTSFLVSISDVALNLLVSFLTGSVVMLSQALQGLADLITAGVLLVGVRRSKQQADERHQFGYGREILFWVFVAGIFMFVGTGGLSFYFGFQRFVNPEAIQNISLALAMLTFGLITNGYAFSKSVRRLNQSEGKSHWWQKFIRSGLIETKATFLVDFMGTLAALFGLIALGLFTFTGNVQFDGIGAMLIGLSMMVASVLLMVDIKGLIVGRAVPKSTAQKIVNRAVEVEGVQKVLDLRTMYLGSARFLVILEVHLRDGLTTDAIEKIMDQIKAVVQTTVPSVYRVQVEVETPEDELQR